MYIVLRSKHTMTVYADKVAAVWYDITVMWTVQTGSCKGASPLKLTAKNIGVRFRNSPYMSKSKC